MFNASDKNLKLLASFVWYGGVVALSLKSRSLLLAAQSINANESYIWLAVLSGLLIGAVKAKYLFRKICIKNIKRIDKLESPKLWQFYRKRFFVFMFCMVTLGTLISKLSQDNYEVLVGMAILEISIATALLLSGDSYWRKFKSPLMP